ncbi:hypothetical protein [Bosea sp. (in: a-proteobacteria)]|uniref:hypothetical protein n=1 Tax=Bosea sp. (in: a-proteobacteria) TaxID=1871050 RepID=UPI0025C1EC59|nr:hypothetical protein [Bosea sp. (in: a-proteobacteria)]
MTEYESGLIADLIMTLDRLPHASVETSEFRHKLLARPPIGGSRQFDAVIHAKVAGRPVTLVVEIKKSAYPRDVREAVWQLHNQMRGLPANAYPDVVPLIAAQVLSPGARALLQEAGVGYYDGDGNLFVPAQGAYLYVEKPPSKSAARQIEAVFTGKRARVVHAVWRQDEAWFKVQDIAKRANVSPATASETLQELENREWVRSEGAGPAKLRQLADRTALLDAWRDHQKGAAPANPARYYVSSPDPNWTSYRLDDACTALGAEYEVTGQVAGQAYAPFLTQISKLHCRISPSRQEEVLDELKARPVQEGWNLGVLETTEAEGLLFRQRDKDMRWLADPLQTYLDLLREGGRSNELATHLREERLDI